MGAFLCLRFDGLDGSLHGTLSLRWSPRGEDKFLAAQGSIGTAKGAAVVKLQPGDWPGFRGPERDGRLTGVRIATDWNQNPPKELWRHRVGPSWGSFAVVGDNIYTQEQRDKQESVVCYDASTGKQIWAHDDATRFDEAMGGAGPRATPTFHDGKIYALGANGRLNCLDAATGAVVWTRDIAADSGASLPTWGFASSPLVVGDVVTVIAAGSDEKSVLGYDAASGKPPVWSAAAGKMSYSSPQPAKLDGVEQVLCLTEQGLTAFDPAKGEVLWKYDQPQAMHRVLQPTLVGDSDVLVASFTGTSRVHVLHDKDGWKTEEVWSSPALKPNYNDMVVYDGFAYGYDADNFVCVSLEDGRQKWRTKAYGSGQVLLLADQGVLLVLSEKPCVAALLEATPQGARRWALAGVRGKDLEPSGRGPRQAVRPQRRMGGLLPADGGGVRRWRTSDLRSRDREGAGRRPLSYGRGSVLSIYCRSLTRPAGRVSSNHPGTTLLTTRPAAMQRLHRRDFLRTAAASAAALSALTAAGAADQPNDKVQLAFIGVHGRGRDLLHGFTALRRCGSCHHLRSRFRQSWTKRSR